MFRKILLHICCAPCGCFPLNELKKDGFEIVLYWYNPNIHGLREYEKRLNAVRDFCKIQKCDIIEDKYDIKKWFKKIGDFTFGERCLKCWKMRLDKAAKTAAKSKIKFFTTTLLYSRFQNHGMIKKLAEEAGDKFRVEFLYSDFRKGWNEGIMNSKKMSLYRQQYCGCVFSEVEKEIKKG